MEEGIIFRIGTLSEKTKEAAVDKFKKGDRVRITEKADAHRGKYAIVVTAPYSFLSVCDGVGIRVDGYTTYIGPDDKHSIQVSHLIKDFSPGDRVLVHACKNNGEPTKLDGKTGKVLTHSSNGEKFTVHVDGYGDAYFYYEETVPT